MSSVNEAEPDIDQELDELETRLERLRSLYEQYFLGIEKIEPNIARKDVDRRIWTLRRMKFRNTAKRFKLQTIVMRYNTYQQYWQRICREIENGTYRRHLIKAEKRAGMTGPLTIAARKRLGMFAKGEEAAAERERAQDAKRSAEDDLAALMDQPQSALDNAMKALDDVFAGKAEPQRSKTSAAAQEQPPASSRQPQREPAKKLGKLSLDFGLDGLGGTGRTQPTRQERPEPKPSATPAQRPAPKPVRPATQPGPPPGGVHRPAAVPSQASASRAPAIATKPGVGTGSGIGRPPPPVTRAATRPGVAPPSGPGAPRLPPPAPARAARPPLARPAAPARPPAPQRPPVRAAAADAAVSDQRVREIHARLVDAKRQTNDAKSVSVDGLARSLRATEAQLRQKHGNRKIDFDVVIKDGKALLKPTVK